MRKLISLNPTVHCIGAGSFLGLPPPLGEVTCLGAPVFRRLRDNGLEAHWGDWPDRS